MAQTAVNPMQQLQIHQQTVDGLLANNAREEEQKKLREHESARDRVREGMLDPPEKVSDEMIEDAKQRKDMEEGNYLRNPENIQKMMKILNTGVTTYKTLQQIPIQVIKGLLLKGLLGPEAMAGEQAQDGLKIGLPPSQTQGHGEGLGPGATMRIKQMLERDRLEKEEKNKNKKKLKIKK